MTLILKESHDDLPSTINLVRFSAYMNDLWSNREGLTKDVIRMEREDAGETESLEQLQQDLTNLYRYGNVISDTVVELRQELGFMVDCRTFLLRMKKRIMENSNENSSDVLTSFIRDASNFLGKQLFQQQETHTEEIEARQVEVRAVVTHLLISQTRPSTTPIPLHRHP